MDRQPEKNEAIQALREDKPESSNASFHARGMLEDFSVSSTSFVETEATKALKSSADNTVSVEAKCEDATLDFSRTREFSGVSSDKKSDKENQREIFCPSTTQDIEDNDPIYDEEDIHLTGENPEVLSDNESDMDGGEVDVLGNTGNIQHAFIFCANMGTIKWKR